MFYMTRTIYDIQNEIVYCTRCGIGHSSEEVYKRVTRKSANPDWCRDCRDNRKDIRRDHAWKHPVLGKIYCWLWLYELDADWRPIDEQGQLVRPGERICGLKDCVKKTHIMNIQDE